MSVPTAGQPGTFLVDRPTLSFILILCAVALLGLSGEARAGHVLGLVRAETALPALGASGLVILAALLAAAAPARGLVRNGLSLACLLAGAGGARIFTDMADAALVCAVLAALAVWLGQFLGRATALSVAIGQGVVLLIAAGAAAWLARTGTIAPDTGPGMIAGFGLALAIAGTTIAIDNFVARIASNDGARLAAAHSINTQLRHLVILTLAAMLFGWLGLVPLPQAGTVAPVLVLPVSVLLFGAGTVAATGVCLSLNTLYEPVTRSADRGWLKAGLTISRLSGFARPVIAAAVLGMLFLAIVTALALAPGGEMRTVLVAIAGWTGLFAIVLLVTVSFRTALIVTLALLAADLAIAPVLSPLTTGTAAADWRWLVTLLIGLPVLRQAGIWRGEVARLRRGRELMVRTMAAGLPGASLALVLAALSLSAMAAITGQAGLAPVLAADIVLRGLTALMTANLLAILLRSIIRESERQVASAAL